MLKKIIRSPLMQYIFANIIALYMNLIKSTTKWEYVGLENIEPLWAKDTGLVVCYWHSRIMLAHSAWPEDKQKVNMLISLSKDGQFVAKATEIIGRKVVRGSSTSKKGDASSDKGALQAVRSLISVAKQGEVAMITPDGPRGPRMRIQAGSVRIAKSARVPMVPLAMAVKGSKYLDSWDRFVIPPLFSKGVIIFGKPIEVSGNTEEAYEKCRLDVENEMNRITNLADKMVGGPQIDPA